MKTPVVFLIFKRPDTTERVFESIRKAQPYKLLVVADGPRPGQLDEINKCEATRAIINRVDWDCEVLKNYSDINLGCKLRVSTGLDWVFSIVEQAIILEDDCVPHPTFFHFCEELLDYYRHDERIMVISGDNFQFGRKRTEYSYYFSRYNHCWGWATWRRAWQHYDIEMKLWPKIRDNNWLEDILEDPRAVKYWRKILQSTYDEEINSWAYRWTFACWLQSGLSLIPNVNLVSNIGFGTEATHTSNTRSPFANLPLQPMDFPLKHPPFMIRDIKADQFTQNNHYNVSLIKRGIRKLRRVAGELVEHSRGSPHPQRSGVGKDSAGIEGVNPPEDARLVR